MTDFEYEKEKLKEILEKYILELEELGITVKRLPEMYRDNPILLTNLLSTYENKLRLMKEGNHILLELILKKMVKKKLVNVI